MIQLKNVSKFYYSKGMISSGISKVNLSLSKGEFVVITGESGSGKSTLLNVISGLDSYEEGEMYIDGKETSHFLASDFEDYRKKYIGNIFQSFNLVGSYTVYQNVELILRINGYSKDEIEKRVPKIVERVGLTAHMKTKVSKLSGGQKQRVSIARALAKDTDIIVADEPTGNLDSVSAEGIVALLSEISKDKLVVVVTHNYNQFQAYATRKIKMHDGKIVEDEQLARAASQEVPQQPQSPAPSIAGRSSQATGNISAGSKIRLGIRNTFNIIPKFFLLLIVFLFLVLAITSEYTSFLHNEEESSSIGYNDYFYNLSDDRIVLKKGDGSVFTEDDYNAIKQLDNVKSVAANDIVLDTGLSIERDDISYEAVPRPVNEFTGELTAGRMPEADNEVILAAESDDYIFQDNMQDEILDHEFSVYLMSSTYIEEINVTVVGIAYKNTDDSVSHTYGGDIYISDAMMKNIMMDTYKSNSTVTTTINGKSQTASADSSLYSIEPSSKVAQGSAVASEELNNFYEKGEAKGNSITVTAENIYYTESVSLKVADVYNKKTFESKTGDKDYDTNGGTIYISQADYNTLFAKGNYQSSVYVNEVRELETTADALSNMGYIELPLRDTLVLFEDDVVSIIQVPFAILIVLALFFIAYFVIRLILRSRASYFSILRMLGMAKKNIRRILDVEMFTVINIAYAVFLAVVILVKTSVINVNYIQTLVEYMQIKDYVILYGVLIVMGYLISGKFARSLFKKTAIGAYREED